MDCHAIIDKIKQRIYSWSTKTLSYASRLQLVKSVLVSLQMYWSSVFLLPRKVTKVIEQLPASFLWTGTDNSTGAKVKR